jgi:hypothetical protein
MRLAPNVMAQKFRLPIYSEVSRIAGESAWRWRRMRELVAGDEAHRGRS